MVDLDPAAEVVAWPRWRRALARWRAQSVLDCYSSAGGRDVRLVLLLAACSQSTPGAGLTGFELDSRSSFNLPAYKLARLQRTTTAELAYLTRNMANPYHRLDLAGHRHGRPWMALYPVLAFMAAYPTLDTRHAELVGDLASVTEHQLWAVRMVEEALAGSRSRRHTGMPHAELFELFDALDALDPEARDIFDALAADVGRLGVASALELARIAAAL